MNDIEQDVAWLVNKLGGQFSDDCKVFDRVVRALLAERDRLREALTWMEKVGTSEVRERARAALTAGEK